MTQEEVMSNLDRLQWDAIANNASDKYLILISRAKDLVEYTKYDAKYIRSSKSTESFYIFFESSEGTSVKVRFSTHEDYKYTGINFEITQPLKATINEIEEEFHEFNHYIQ